MFFLRSKKNHEPKITRKLEPSTPEESNSFKIIPSSFQHIGNRKKQEDAFTLSDFRDSKLIEESGLLAVVADGMGGLDCGEDASSVAVRVFLREYYRNDVEKTIPDKLNQALESSNTAVFDLAYQDGTDLDVGTTLVAVTIFNHDMYWVSVGDSRIYHYRKNVLTQLTKEHIYRNKLMDDVQKGLISIKEAENHPEGAYLTSYLGLPSLPEIDLSSEPLLLEVGDRVLLCSDGLSNTLSEQEIELILIEAENISSEELVKIALKKQMKYQDNITAVLLSCNKLEP